jgi:hypothetical protein
MDELANRFKGARRCLKLRKISSCREGALEACAMVRTQFRKLEPEHMARVGRVGSDGQEIPLHLVYDQVMRVTRLSQRDCALDSIIENVDKE